MMTPLQPSESPTVMVGVELTAWCCLGAEGNLVTSLVPPSLFGSDFYLVRVGRLCPMYVCVVSFPMLPAEYLSPFTAVRCGGDTKGATSESPRSFHKCTA